MRGAAHGGVNLPADASPTVGFAATSPGGGGQDVTSPSGGGARRAVGDLPPLREVIARHGLAAKKSLGQNFLLDGNLLAKIARVPGPLAGALAYEVGPGPGGLTRALLAAGARVVAVERDDRALPALAELGEVYPGRLRIEGADATAVDETALLGGEAAHVLANLPYNIATALLVRWLTIEPWPPWWLSLTLMFQREVAERIVAAPGSEAYGRLAVLTGARARAKIALTLPPDAFTPAPKVSSAVVHLVPLPSPRAPVHGLERVTAAAFGQRRKMLRAAMRALPGGVEALGAAGLSGERRAETLTVAEFEALACAWVAGNGAGDSRAGDS